MNFIILAVYGMSIVLLTPMAYFIEWGEIVSLSIDRRQIKYPLLIFIYQYVNFFLLPAGSGWFCWYLFE